MLPSSTPPRASGRTSSATWATCSPAPSTSSPRAPRGCSSASSTDPSSSTDSALRPASSSIPNPRSQTLTFQPLYSSGHTDSHDGEGRKDLPPPCCAEKGGDK